MPKKSSSRAVLRSRSGTALSKLPNAPLAEVVFEVRWDLLGEERLGPFRRDPGYFSCVDALIEKAKLIGYRVHKTITPEGQLVSPYAIEHRFYRSEDEMFPVLQIGPGIFAINESTEYMWGTFKERCLSAMNLLTQCYPKMANFSFFPNQFQLRYIDALKPAESSQSLIEFLKDSTYFEFHLPIFLISDVFGQIGDTQIKLALPVRGHKDTSFTIDLSKGKASNVDAFLMQSAFTSKIRPGALGKSAPAAQSMVGTWLEAAHSVTSPFFQSAIKDSLMSEYREPQPNA